MVVEPAFCFSEVWNLPAAVALIGMSRPEDPADTYAPPPDDYAGVWRVWGPTDDRDTGRHDWAWEIAVTLDGPFSLVRPHAHEWWDGAAWIGTD